MSEENLNQFLTGAMVLCLIMGVLSPLGRWKRYGPAALPLGIAFLVMALLLHGLTNGWAQGAIIGVAAVLVLLLAADALLRSNSELKK
jgi:hypothetical protein